jgi:hypothetical protein
MKRHVPQIAFAPHRATVNSELAQFFQIAMYRRPRATNSSPGQPIPHCFQRTTRISRIGAANWVGFFEFTWTDLSRPEARQRPATHRPFRIGVYRRPFCFPVRFVKRL